MSSYICKNFQLSIPYNFQFHHMVLKCLPSALNTILEIFYQWKSFSLIEYSGPVEYSTKSKFFLEPMTSSMF